MSTTPGEPALDRRRAEDHVRLDVAVAELLQVVDRVQAGPLVGQVRVEVALLARQRHRRAGEGQPLVVARVDVARHEDRVLAHAVGRHAALDQVDVQVHEPAHLDRAAERDLAVALGEVQVTHRELRAVDEHRVEDPAALGQVLDVLVAAVLARRCGAGGLGGGPGEVVAGEAAEDRRVRAAAAAPAAAPGSGRCRSGPARGRSTWPAASAEGAVPMRPGCTMPVNDTPGTCRDVATPPRKSQITL